MDELRTITRMVSPIPATRDEPRDSPVPTREEPRDPTRDTDADDEEDYYKETESEKSDSWWLDMLKYAILFLLLGQSRVYSPIHSHWMHLLVGYKVEIVT